MFDNLREGLRGALKKIVGASDINEELIDSLCKDVQRALLQSDVNVRLVLSITQNLKERALKEQPPKGLSRKDHIVTILYGELAKMLGYSGEVIKTIDKAQEDDHQSVATSFFKPGKQNVVLLLGIQGSGKTTVATGLMAALRRAGSRVAPFKVGPDYIDPGYHSLATGRPGRNLDPVLVGEGRIPGLFAHGSKGCDIAVVEGVLGLFDGRVDTAGVGSTAHVAKLINAPVLFVVDARGAGSGRT